ncbi:protein EXECUTER 1, chloroplastic [Magnolia sinica]|uniref:protein EXECUTER 1, chloroplastic n=1 Tax=Magnolia sinica TaxID=86752 RepID=UPI00265A8F22|nr:protein EXECUTER 1, chloroplastic [Magnolia sinica]
MASISSPRFSSPSSQPDQNPRRSLSKSSRFLAPPPSKTFPASSRPSNPSFCRCQNRSDSRSPYDDFIRPRLDSLQDAARNAFKWWNDNLNPYRSPSKDCVGADVAGDGKAKEKDVGDWDWDRWKRHFDEVEEQEKIVSVLKSQLSDAVHREDYEDAAKLKVAIAAAARNDIVGRAISCLNRAVEEERYQDAAFIRDHAGAGLVGWWAGISEDSTDPYGRIIHIRAEHGRYVARSYSSRQLATATPGVPLFEVFITANDEGEYKQQAVYLKRNRGNSGDFLTKSSKPSAMGSLNSSTELAEGETDLSARSSGDLEEGEERDDDSDVVEERAGIQSILRDMIPGFKVNSVKVVASGKLDTDLVFKAFEQDSEEEDEEKDVELESIEPDDELKAESDGDEIEMDAGGGVSDTSEEGRAMVVKIVIGDLAQRLSNNMPPKDLLRVPARLEKRGRLSFLFSIKKDENRQEADGKGQKSIEKSTKLPGQRSIDHVMSDLAKVLISREKIPAKVLKDVEELINLTLSQAQNRQPLSGATVFNRIEIPPTSDPLNGLYMGAHGLYTSEIIHLRRKFGQWQEDGRTKKSPDLEFYEYVEALKLTGDPYVPAGQVAFRAKVGKRNQLPHKGIIPEEFGVVARYRGQGRLAEPGFRNPRWVDGELVILDGKYIRGGPVVGFVYWAPEYHFLVFFNRLKLQD